MSKIKRFGKSLLKGLIFTGITVAIALAWIFTIELLFFSGANVIPRIIFAAILLYSVWTFGWRIE